MAGENIRLSTTYQPNFTAYQGYFFTFDHGQDNLLQKTDDGNTAFSYPFDVLLTNPIKDAQFDGVYFWSQENPGGGDVYIKKWKIENYVCKLQQTFSLLDGVSHTYSSETFSVAHYHTSLSALVTSGTSTLYLNDYWDDAILMGFTTTSGDGLTLHIGPNTNGEEEDVEVSSTVSGGVTIAAPIQHDYAQSDAVNFFTHLWVFNNYNGTDSATGALYKFDAHTGDYITKYASGAYKDVYASTFYNVDSFAEYGDVDTLAYIKGTNTLFINVGAAGATLPYYGSMVMDNIASDSVTVLVVYALTMDDQNVYRLQVQQDGSGGAWSTYNYQLSTLDSFVTSISLAAYPATIAANAIATSSIVAIVKDQFLQPIVSRLVAFTEDDPVGFIVTTPVNTNSQGVSQTSYRTGTSAREVQITATVEQT